MAFMPMGILAIREANQGFSGSLGRGIETGRHAGREPGPVAMGWKEAGKALP